MRIVILGGCGVFGSRLAELLVRDGHAVVVTGRDRQKTAALAARLHCEHLVLDHRQAPQALFCTAPEVVIDTAGPFRADEEDAYLVPRLCLEHGADYLDISNDATFTQGICALDGLARSRQRRLLSGASSVPGISSTVAAELCAGLDEILLIDSAILPGSLVPLGKAVLAGIVSQLGSTFSVFRGGVWRRQSCWSDPQRVPLSAEIVRRAWLFEVPDIRLFPAFFKARSVTFRAGFDLGILNTAIRLVAALRRHWKFPVPGGSAELLRHIGKLLLAYGTDRGGMRVLVVGRRGEAIVQRQWRLLAQAGCGPYIPAVTARAMLRKLGNAPFGARPCLAETSRAEIEAAMADLAVATSIEESPRPTLFQAALADRWQHLPPEVRALHSVHDVESFSGVARVTRGTTLLARLAAWFFGFPPAAEQIPLTVTKSRSETGEVWERDFGGCVFRSFLTPAPTPYRYRERFGFFNYEQDLPVEDGCMRLPVHRGWFLGIPLPRFLLPRSESREYACDGVFHFDVALIAPLGAGLIVRYQGHLKPDAMPAGLPQEAKGNASPQTGREHDGKH